MFKPKEMEPDKRYPTLIFVYDGPAVQVILFWCSDKIVYLCKSELSLEWEKLV